MLRSNKGVKANQEESLVDPVIETFLPDPSKMNRSMPRHGKSFICTILVCTGVILSLSALAVASSQSEETIQLSHKLRKMRSSSASYSVASVDQTYAQPKSLKRENLESVTLGSKVLGALHQEQEGDNDEAPPGVAQMLVHSGIVSLNFPSESKSVGSVDAIANQIETIVREDGKGYTESRSQESQSVRQYVRMTVRVANAEFSDMIDKLQTLTAGLGGTVESLATRSEDVTDEYVDSTARADTLTAARKAMEGILSRADKVKDVLEIQRELNSLMQQEESLRKRALQLKGSSDMSTISLTLSQTVKDSGFGEGSQWHPKTAMGLAVDHMSIVVRFAVDTLSYALVWLLPMVVLFILFRTYKLCAKG